MSWGGFLFPIFLAIEDRFRTVVALAGGLPMDPALPEADPIRFVNRVKIPVLMINGRYDPFFPLDSSQLPLFRLLGTPDKDKRHIIHDSGHIPDPMDYARESLDWLDKTLGPVKR